MENIDILRLSLFLGLLVLFSSLETIWPRRARLQNRRRRWATNLGLAALGSLSLLFLGPFMALSLAVHAAENGWGLFNYTRLPVWIELILAFILLDLSVWFQHLLTHKIPLLWRLHKVHHADRDLDASSAVRFHPLEILLSMIYKGLIVLILGPAVLAVIIFEITLNGSAIFNHANLTLPSWLDRILRVLIVTPDMHRIHHSAIEDESQKNYGFNFSIWDKVFNTYQRAPKEGHTKMIIGLKSAQDDAPQKLGWSLWLPFRPNS